MSASIFFNPNAKPRVLCQLTPNCGCHGFKAPSREAVAQHEAEIGRRMAWCVQEGRIPANAHVHEAPGDDRNFVYKVPPWQADGSPNPAGIYFTPEDPVMAALGKENADVGWTCTRCGEWVPRPPREFRNGEEPWNWWFCFDCKAKAVKPSQKTINAEKAAQGCQRLDGFLARTAEEI